MGLAARLVLLVVKFRALRGHALHLLPVGGITRAQLARPARAIGQQYGIRVSILPRIRSALRFVDEERGQLDSSWLVWHLRRTYGIPKRRAAVVGVTGLDLFFSGRPEWLWAFGSKDRAGYAAVSTARMDQNWYGASSDPGLLATRLHKMLLRYTGDLYFRLQRDGGPESVMRPEILGTDELDAVDAAFCPRRPAAVRTC